MEQNFLTVTQLNNYLKRIIDSEYLIKNISIVGEVSGFSISRNIAYFSLKDESSLLSVVMFDADNKYKPANGESIILTGSINYYVKGGKITFNATKIEKYGLGKLYEDFLKLKEQLTSEGLFDSKYKKALPSKIERVGVITSKTGAVIQDIKNVGFRRNKNIEIVLYPVKVQGDNAEKEIATAINFFNNYNVDIIIVARGGGSAEDLQPFNTEIVARTVFNCTKPVVSAVGHETDFTIIDFVADLRAPTPSAAAELVFADTTTYLQKIKMLNIRMNNSIQYIFDKFEGKINNSLEKCLNICESKITSSEYFIKANCQKMVHLTDSQIELNNLRFSTINEKLNSLNPEKIFKLGYSVLTKNNELIKDCSQIHDNDILNIRFFDENINVKVTKLEE